MGQLKEVKKKVEVVLEPVYKRINKTKMKYLKRIVIVVLILIGAFYTVMGLSEWLSKQINNFANEYKTEYPKL